MALDSWERDVLDNTVKDLDQIVEALKKQELDQLAVDLTFRVGLMLGLIGRGENAEEKFLTVTAILKQWHDFEQDNLKKDGPYCGVKINELIKRTQDVLVKVGAIHDQRN